MKPHWLAALLGGLLCATGACEGGDAPPSDAKVNPDLGPPAIFAEAPCPNAPVAFPVRCGTLTVPESRAPGSDGKTISLFVLVVKSSSPTPAPDPLVYLAGGPGESSVATILALIQAPLGPLTATLAKRDVVAIDQRGIGRSLPQLQCAELATQPLGAAMGTLGMVRMQQADILDRCQAGLRFTGVDLAQYQTANSADDLAAARPALGFKEWNVLGASYGTRLALELMRRHPEGLRSVILDSVLPPGIDLLAETAPSYMRSLDLLFATCSAQPACASAYPNLRTVLLALVAKLDSNPVVISSAGGPRTVTGWMLASIISRLLYSAQVMRDLPEVIFQLSEGDQDLFEAAFGGMMAANDDLLELNWGLHYSVMCADALPFTTAAKIEMRAAGVPAEVKEAFTMRGYHDLCPRWKVPASPSSLNEAVSSTLPTLILSGELDPATPPAWSLHAAKSLPRSVRFELKGESHGIFFTVCGSQLMTSFLDDPTRPPPASCVTNRPGLQLAIHR